MKDPAALRALLENHSSTGYFDGAQAAANY
jgi:hypothetical protein